MNKFVLTSVHFTGAVQFTYNLDGLLVFYSVLDAEITKPQLFGILKKFPHAEGDLKVLNDTGYFTVKNLNEDLSFEAFWEAYGQKIHPGRCEPVWKKMSDVKRLAALQAIPAYDFYLSKKGTAKANPEKYLKVEYWKTNWSKEV